MGAPVDDFDLARQLRIVERHKRLAMREAMEDYRRLIWRGAGVAIVVIAAGVLLTMQLVELFR